MLGILLTVLMFFVVVAAVRATSKGEEADRLLKILAFGYVLRMLVQSFSRDLAFFSHGGGGDYVVYEYRAMEVVRYWQFEGFGFVSSTEMPDLGPTSLPPNLFAAVIALNGNDPTPLGCTSVVAAMACLTCLNLYQLGVELGAERRGALVVMVLLLFSPAFVLYTSDMYKDGPVIFVTTAAVASAIRLSRRLSLVHAVIGGVSLLALWYIRYYLVFFAVAPLLVGLTGLRAKSGARPLFAALFLAAAFLILAASGSVFEDVSERASETFLKGTARNVIAANSQSGSGVTFDDGGNPWGAMGPKLTYMIFSPFPWAGGSVGFQIGKIDTFVWYYILYRCLVAARSMWRTDRTTLLTLLTFLLPITVVYATSFANVGLSLRQRLVIVMVGAVLAMQSRRARVAATGPRTAPIPSAPRMGPPRPAMIRSRPPPGAALDA